MSFDSFSLTDSLFRLTQWEYPPFGSYPPISSYTCSVTGAVYLLTTSWWCFHDQMVHLLTLVLLGLWVRCMLMVLSIGVTHFYDVLLSGMRGSLATDVALFTSAWVRFLILVLSIEVAHLVVLLLSMPMVRLVEVLLSVIVTTLNEWCFRQIWFTGISCCFSDSWLTSLTCYFLFIWFVRGKWCCQ